MEKVAGGFFSSSAGKNKPRLFPLNTPQLYQVFEVRDDCKLGLQLCLPVSVDASLCPESRTGGSRVPWNHSKDFWSEESRCDDNHLHLKSSEACRATLSGVLLGLHSVQSAGLLTDGKHPLAEPAVGWTLRVCAVGLSRGSSAGLSGALQESPQSCRATDASCVCKSKLRSIYDKGGFFCPIL